MRIHSIATAFFVFFLLVSAAAGASITGSTVSGTNIYAGSTVYNIGPAAEIDSTSTATGITNIAGRYVYASGLAYTQAAQIVTYSIATRQGAAVTATNQGTELGMYWDYGDGNTATTEELTHRYRTPSTYITTLQLSSYLQETPTTITTSVSLATSGAIDNAVSNTNVYAGSRLYDIAPSAYLKGGNSATGITNIAGRYLYASDLTAALSGSTATITAADRQGAAVNATTQGTTGTYSWDYGDGATATTTATDSTTHAYSTGIYSAKVEIPGYFGNLILYTDPINVGVPTYTAEDITTQDFDIVVEAGQLYQPLTQYILPSTKADMEFFAGNLFVLASGRTVYTIDAGTATATPVSTTTGTTAETIYLGENAAIITDTAGNTAVYVYEAGTFDYLSSGGSDKIATTANYAGIVNDGTLSIYDLSTGKKIGSTPANIEAFAGNDYGDTFAGFAGSTISYWWVDNAGAIQSGSANITQTVTGLKQIAQTENYIVTTDTNTLIIGVSGVGEYNLVATSETDTPLTTPQATTIGVIIGVHSPNEIYIIGADGATAGTYQTGAALADSSITKATGLYAITGGADQQAYILRKDQESTWSLAQILKTSAAISHAQISTTGTYSAVLSAANLYLLKMSTQQDTSYYLQGMVIDSHGMPYKGVVFINGEKVNSDASGKFTYPVTPGMLYEIVVDTTTVEYTATNAALQQVAIKLSVNPLAADIQYSAEYNAATQNIEMSYYDMADKTQSVVWEVRQTNNNTIVATYTGTTAAFPVPAGDIYQNYYITVAADRGDYDITKSWSITPAGGSPVDLFGLDDNGKNIIFGFLLLIIAGLFGAMHSARGAVLTAFAACVLRYLELITIPWVVILVAAVLAVIAAIAGGQR